MFCCEHMHLLLPLVTPSRLVVLLIMAMILSLPLYCCVHEKRGTKSASWKSPSRIRQPCSPTSTPSSPSRRSTRTKPESPTSPRRQQQTLLGGVVVPLSRRRRYPCTVCIGCDGVKWALLFARTVSFGTSWPIFYFYFYFYFLFFVSYEVFFIVYFSMLLCRWSLVVPETYCY